MKHTLFKITHIQDCSLLLLFVILFIAVPKGLSQTIQNDHRIFFISDVQEPMLAEKMVSKYYRNEEARDSLFSDIIRHHPEYLFLLGDLTSMGSNEKAWVPIDTFLHGLSLINTKVFSIPGNHEYMMNSLPE